MGAAESTAVCFSARSSPRHTAARFLLRVALHSTLLRSEFTYRIRPFYHRLASQSLWMKSEQLTLFFTFLPCPTVLSVEEAAGAQKQQRVSQVHPSVRSSGQVPRRVHSVQQRTRESAVIVSSEKCS